ncbi:MAG: leucine-rich repeat domain-containing protein, partial [Thiolinea sp.]
MSAVGAFMLLSPKEEALKRIGACRQAHAESLDLSKLLLDEIPKEVFELTWLRKLDVSYGKRLSHVPMHGMLKTIPQEIEKLSSLTELKIDWNCFADISHFLKYLPQLQSLSCSDNPLTDLSALEHVPQLQSL